MAALTTVRYFCSLLVVSTVTLASRKDDLEVQLKKQLVNDLGMPEGISPDVRRANVSALEWVRMRGVWLEAERQAALVKGMRKEWRRVRRGQVRELEVVARLEERLGLQGETKIKLWFPLQDMGAGMMVQEAKLRLKVEGLGGSLVKVVEEEEGITVSNNLVGEVEIEDEVQAWLEEPQTNLGLLLLLPPGSQLVGLPSISLRLEEGRRGRSRRSLMTKPSSDCSNRRDNRCCRNDMVVDLTSLQGFEFIFEPQQFNAYMCGGKCPARFLPLNDHSLLQSLMHLKGMEDNDAPRVKRPCCVPSKYESMNILHLDPENATKLKVTSWKNIIVTQCACG